MYPSLTEREKFIPDKKYSVFCLDDDQLDVLRCVYGELIWSSGYQPHHS